MTVPQRKFAVSIKLKYSIVLGTLIGLGFYFTGLLIGNQLNWIGWLVAYPLCFAVFHFVSFTQASAEEDFEEGSGQTTINSAHLEALYKQAMIVERNAQKANAVFSKQLAYVNKLVQKTRDLSPGDDFDMAHGNLIKELDVLEHHVERLLEEMQKNVKLGEKLQQSVANLDPEIGVL